MATNLNAATATPAEPVRKAPRRRWIMIGLGVIVLIAGLIWLVQWWTVGRFIEDTNDAYLRADSVAIAPKVSGYVTALYVADNQAVRAGQPLVKLDVRQYQAALQQADASIDARRADIVRAKADVIQQRATIDHARAQAEAAKVSADHAAHEYQRFLPLAATGAETAERLADLRSTRDQERANYAASLASLKSAEAQIATLNAQIVQAQAQVEASQASRQASNLDLQDTIVKSAIDGRVGDRTVQVGQYVQPGTRLMTVVPVQDVYIVANFKETQVGAMRVGQPATLHVDALPDSEIRGVVDSFSPGTGSEFALLPPENATGNFTKIVQRVPVRIRINADAPNRNQLLPGMSVTVDVDTAAPGHVQPVHATPAQPASGQSAAAQPASGQPAQPAQAQPASTGQTHG